MVDFEKEAIKSIKEQFGIADDCKWPEEDDKPTHNPTRIVFGPWNKPIIKVVAGSMKAMYLKALRRMIPYTDHLGDCEKMMCMGPSCEVECSCGLDKLKGTTDAATILRNRYKRGEADA